MSLSNADRSHLKQAQRLASMSSMRQRHGAVIAAGRRIVGVGINTYRADPNTVTDPKQDASWHAEIMALRSLPPQVKPAALSLYVARVNAKGETRHSEPCTYCRQALFRANILRLVWTTSGPGEGESVFVI